jgi:hypothetical protein
MLLIAIFGLINLLYRFPRKNCAIAGQVAHTKYPCSAAGKEKEDC